MALEQRMKIKYLQFPGEFIFHRFSGPKIHSIYSAKTTARECVLSTKSGMAEWVRLLQVGNRGLRWLSQDRKMKPHFAYEGWVLWKSELRRPNETLFL